MTSPPTPAPTPAVADWLGAVPAELRTLAERIRALVHAVACEVDATPLVEELKWGQPSYRSPHGNESTPVRIGWTDDGDVAVLAHCQSSVVADFRAAFPHRFRYDGNRAVLLGPSDLGRVDELGDLVGHALTYRRR